jgi:hypothetical protein
VVPTVIRGNARAPRRAPSDRRFRHPTLACRLRSGHRPDPPPRPPTTGRRARLTTAAATTEARGTPSVADAAPTPAQRSKRYSPSYSNPLHQAQNPLPLNQRVRGSSTWRRTTRPQVSNTLTCGLSVSQGEPHVATSAHSGRSRARAAPEKTRSRLVKIHNNQQVQSEARQSRYTSLDACSRSLIAYVSG